MASPLRLTLGHETTDPLEAARRWQVVLDEFEAAEAAMSRFAEASELTALNRMAGSGAVVHPSTRLRGALVTADRAHRLSAGRFDPRVLADLDRLGYRGAALGPLDEEGQHSDRRIYDGPVVERTGRDGLTVVAPVDLGGIGKGLALRWAVDLLERDGASDFLLEAGGDLVARGRDGDEEIWRVGIEDPAGGDDLAVFALVDGAVATSSIKVNRWMAAGRVVHHLLDPRTGEPAENGLIAVTVAGPDPAWAEVWAKVLFVGGRGAIATEARSRGLAAWWVADDGALEMTANARAMTLWVAAEAA